MNDPSERIVQTIAFEILEQCNFYCDFCVRSAHRKLSTKLSQAQFEARLQTVRFCFPSVEHVALTGGEPFLHPDLVNFANLAADAGCSVSITTNGSIRDSEKIRQLSQIKNVYPIVSIDGATNLIHDTIRGFPGALERAKEFCRICGDVGFAFGVNITVNATNQDSVFDTIVLAKTIGASDVSVALVKPEGRGALGDSDRTTLANVARQVEQAKKLLYGSIKISFTEPLSHIFDVTAYHPAHRRTCGAGGSSLHIQCNGSVLICTSCTQSLGNIDSLGENLLENWRTDHRLHSIRTSRNIGGACGTCQVFDYCGGCRCRAEKGSNFLGEDPLCPKVRDPLLIQTSSSAIEAAKARISPASARDPGALRQWLRAWQKEMPLDRRNLDFAGQRAWGHDYPLGGDETIRGEMGTRHLDILQTYLASGALPNDLTGLRILDIGCWTGGEALLLAALGATVDAVEEHPYYLETTARLAYELDLPVSAFARSIFDLPDLKAEPYDVVYLSGVISHLSDPVTALRIAFNSLVDGGLCLLETQTSYALDGRDEYWGANRSGWVWWNLSRPTLLEMLHNVGFAHVKVIDFGANRRFQLCAERRSTKVLPMRMGLSLPIA